MAAAGAARAEGDGHLLSDVMMRRLLVEKGVAAKLLKEVTSDVAIDKGAASRRSQTAGSLRAISESEPDPRFRRVFESLAEAIGEIERTRRSVLCDRFSETLLEPMQMLLTEHFKAAEVVLADRSAAIVRATKAQEDAAKATGTAVVVQAKRAAALDATQAAINADAMSQSAMLRAAHQRAADMKELLEEYIRGRMLFHCRALEGFSRASAVLAKADPSLASAEVEAAMMAAVGDSHVLVVPGEGVPAAQVAAARQAAAAAVDDAVDDADDADDADGATTASAGDAGAASHAHAPTYSASTRGRSDE